MENPLSLTPVFHLGPVPITMPVLVTWAIMLGLALFSILATRRLRLAPAKIQTVLELFVSTIDSQIHDTMQRDPMPFRALIGTIFLFVLVANWTSVLPGIEPPTAHLETDAALAFVVLGATIFYGVTRRGLLGYLATFAEPSWVMIPLNLVEQITRTFSLFVRLFGNVMSGVFIIGIVLSLAGLFVPIPLMALDLLTGAVQAYIFAVLATVFIGAAVGENTEPQNRNKRTAPNDRQLDRDRFDPCRRDCRELWGDWPRLGRRPRRSGHDGRHRTPARSRRNPKPDAVRRACDDRDDGHLHTGDRASGAVRQPVRLSPPHDHRLVDPRPSNH